MAENPEIAKGANVIKGQVTHEGVAEALGLTYTPVENL
jgi:alanine dehydrogenase